MTTLTREQRKDLERTVRKARSVAEAGARKAIDRLGVGDAKAPAGLSPAEQALRLRLRVHGRQLGDKRDPRRDTQATARLVAETAYEHWHRMLFARFLAETELLIEPTSGMAISLGECQELAREQTQDWVVLASSFAVRMLPQIFRPGDPVLDVALPPETRSELEDLIKESNLPREVFLADDGLGWVYQFWQADEKERVDAYLQSGGKAGADEIPAKTQLFTEDYMVLFLLHNTLGAWWAGKVLASRPELAATAASEDELRAASAIAGIEWTYLRFVREPAEDGRSEGEVQLGPWRPAAGMFAGWPKTAREITVLDPCMGSGHFLVFSLPILVALRMAEEGLSRRDAVDAVLRDNLFGLEIDPRCTQIAAFNLALAAWKLTGHHNLPQLQLACSGLALGVTKDEWLRLAERASPIPPDKDLFGKRENLFSDRVRSGFEALFDLFEKAPCLGSLIDPHRAGASLVEAGYKELEPLLAPILTASDAVEMSEMAVTAQGLSRAAQMLAQRYALVATNVPYLGQRKQEPTLASYCAEAFPDAKSDLASCVVERCLKFLQSGGTTAIVSQQSWLFQSTYKAHRKKLLRERSFNAVARLGEHAFDSPQAAGAFVALTIFSNSNPSDDAVFLRLDVSEYRTPSEKSVALANGPQELVSQAAQLRNPDARITKVSESGLGLLEEHVQCPQGIKTGDDDKWRRLFWENAVLCGRWKPYQSTVESTTLYGGRSSVIDWATTGAGMIRPRLGSLAVGRVGVAVSQMRGMPCTLYLGDLFDSNVGPMVLTVPEDLSALWCYCESGEFSAHVRLLDPKVAIANGTLGKAPFDVDAWRQVAKDKYPDGLPKPYSSDPTQWLFCGHPCESDHPLQVAVARLIGYRWPRQTGSSSHDCPAVEADGLESHVDVDGIVCLNSSKGEASAADRLNGLLAAAYGSEWSAGKLDSLLAGVGFAGKRLDEWLRDGFFANHCEVFHNLPFVWHIWDGRQDGFHALMNYHRLAAPDGEGRRTLEKLIYTYLGDWIDRQRRDQKAGVDGSDALLAAAEHLKSELEKILAGEPPYDIFVRWKPLAEQPIGWEPDINDGVRLNIRPFMTARPLGARAKGACILRTTPKGIKWNKDRGKEPQREKQDFPWFWGWDEETEDFSGGTTFDGNRWNDLHYTTAAKQAARKTK